MITNKKYPILGISPDGITIHRMLEIKCPYTRVIDGKIKTEYYHQIQEQLAVCEFDECDFLECRFEELTEDRFWDDFNYHNPDENINKEKGIIIAYINISKNEVDYLYSPIQLHENQDQLRIWQLTTIQNLLSDKNTLYLTEFYWNLIKYNCQIVHRDPNWITTNYPLLQKFWDEVIYYRTVGVDKLIDKIKKDKESQTQELESSLDIYFAPISHKSDCSMNTMNTPNTPNSPNSRTSSPSANTKRLPATNNKHMTRCLL